MKLRSFAYAVTATSTLLMASGCSSDASNNNTEDDPNDPSELITGQIGAGLTQADSCDDLLTHIQAEGIASLRRTAERLRSGEDYYGGFRGGPVILDGVASDGDVAISVDQGTADPVAAPPPSAPTPNAVGADDSAESAGGREYSETNNQVKGVDEADIVKTDGDHLYLVHGTKLFVVDVSATDATVLQSELQLEGQPLEMFVKDDKAVVYSQVDATPELVGGEAELESIWRFSDSSQSKMTVIDLSGDEPQVLREVYTQGYYVSSRRVDDAVRSVIRGPYMPFGYDTPYIEYYDLFGERYEQEVIDDQVDSWLERKEGELKQTDLDFWLPTQRERTADGVVTLKRDCTSHYVPSPGMTEPGATTIVSLNLADVDDSLGGATILGGADTIYSNAESLVLAHHDYRFNFDEDANEQTALHHFALDGDETLYQGSGFVPGHIINQFAMDQYEGVIRVATTENQRTKHTDPDYPDNWWFEFNPVNRVYTLEGDGDELKILGKTEALGHEGETIFSARFIGDQGYVVTFRQTDPLVVLDLSKPDDPQVAGTLEIPGFSTYLHPMGDDHLLTIGRDGGLQLQIFDVSDPANPKQAHKHVQEGYSAAEGEHKAFNYYPKFNLLTFPFISWGSEVTRSTLEVFRVDASGGFEHVASIDHTDMMRHNCEDRLMADYAPKLDELPAEERAIVEQELLEECNWSVGEVKRGVFIDDLLYSISDGGVMAHDVENFALASSLELPTPEYYYGGYYDDGGVAEPGIAVGAPTPASGPDVDVAVDETEPSDGDADVPAEEAMTDSSGSAG